MELFAENFMVDSIKSLFQVDEYKFHELSKIQSTVPVISDFKETGKCRMKAQEARLVRRGESIFFRVLIQLVENKFSKSLEMTGKTEI